MTAQTQAPPINLDLYWEFLLSSQASEQSLNQFISSLKDLLHADRVRYFSIFLNQNKAENIYETAANPNLSLKHDWKIIDLNELSYSYGQLKASNPVHLTISNPDTAILSDLELLKKQRIENCLILPVPLNKSLAGYIQIDNFKLSLTDADIGRLGKLISNLSRVLPQSKPSFDAQYLPKNENLVDLSFASIDEGLIILNPKAQVVKVNQRVCQLFDKDKEYFADKNLRDLNEIFPQDCLQLLLRNFGFVKMGLKGQPQEFSITTKTGEQKILETGSITLLDGNSSLGELIVVRDITFRKEMEQFAQESETRLRSVLESVKEGITLSDDEGYFEIFNQEMQALTGYSRSEANQTPEFIKQIHPPDEQDKALENLVKLSEGGKLSSQSILLSKDGQEKFVSISTTILSSQGKKYYLSSYHDETAQKHAEEELKTRNLELENASQKLHETAEQLRDARDHLEEKVAQKTQELQQKVIEVEDLAKFPSEDPFPVLRIQSDGVLLYANSASQVLLDKWKIGLNQQIPDDWKTVVNQVYATNNRNIIEIELSNQVISFMIVPVKSGNYVNLYGRDVTREKEVEQMKNQFISMVSHQIRTPITSVRWYSEMLLKGKADSQLNEHQREITNTIHDTAINLSTLVNDLLSISRMESGKIEYNPEPSDLVSLILEVITELRPQAEQGEIQVEFAPPNLDKFNFDPKLIKEVYRNLISNAIKYTPKQGRVKILLEPSETQVITKVIDTGVGIPKEAQKDIFTRFYRAQNVVDQEFEGTGLGLSVAKMIVEKAGGNISFESVENQGSTFTFSIPLQNMI